MQTTPNHLSPPPFNLYKQSEVDILETAEDGGAQEAKNTEVDSVADADT